MSRVFRKIVIFVEKTSTFLKIGNFRISKNIVFPKDREFKIYVRLAIPDFKQTSVLYSKYNNEGFL